MAKKGLILVGGALVLGLTVLALSKKEDTTSMDLPPMNENVTILQDVGGVLLLELDGTRYTIETPFDGVVNHYNCCNVSILAPDILFNWDDGVGRNVTIKVFKNTVGVIHTQTFNDSAIEFTPSVPPFIDPNTSWVLNGRFGYSIEDSVGRVLFSKLIQPKQRGDPQFNDIFIFNSIHVIPAAGGDIYYTFSGYSCCEDKSLVLESLNENGGVINSMEIFPTIGDRDIFYFLTLDFSKKVRIVQDGVILQEYTRI